MSDASPALPIRTQRIRPWLEMAQALDQALDFAAASGARINVNSRLRQYVQRLRAAAASSSASPDREQMSLVRCEVDEIVSALDHLRADPEVPGWPQLVERVQGGALFPGPHHDKARAAQVELVMAAAMRSAGADVSLQEPDDAIARVGDKIVHFEAKRPNSEKGLRQIVRHAREQLARTAEFGALFVDFNQLAQVQDCVLEVSDYDEASRRLEPRLWAALERFGVHMPDWLRGSSEQGKNVLAIFGVLRGRFVIAGRGGGWHYGFIHAIRIERMVPSLSDVPPWFRQFAERIGRLNQPAGGP